MERGPLPTGNKSKQRLEICTGVKLGLEDFVKDVVINCLGKKQRKNSKASSTNLSESFFQNNDF